VPVGAGIVAPVGQFVARFGEGMRGLGLFALADSTAPCALGHCLLGLLRAARASLAAAAASRQRAKIQRASAAWIWVLSGVALSLLGLPPQARDLRVEPGHQVLQPRQIGFGSAQLAFGILAPHVEARDPGGFFQHGAAFGGLGGDHLPRSCPD
jgi:hypothetical protein